MTPRKGQANYHRQKFGERAARREKELTKPLENGNRAPFRICTHTGACLRRYANRIARHFVRTQLRNIVGFVDEFLDLSDDQGAKIITITELPSEAMLREARRNSWMYRKVAGNHCSVTVTAGRIIFNS
jgi:hypothetical protein